jgi:hypothetical protein
MITQLTLICDNRKFRVKKISPISELELILYLIQY